MTFSDWLSIILSAIIIVGIVAIAVLRRGRHRRIVALRRAAKWREQALRHLSPDDREHFGREWSLVEAHFVEDPHNAVAEADRVVEQLLSARGYPVGEWKADAATRATGGNVTSPTASTAPGPPNPPVVQNYRQAHEIVLKQARGDAHGEDLRRAMLDYRVVFDDLVADTNPGAQHQNSADGEHDLVPARRHG